MGRNRIKVAWICHFSSKEYNQKLPLKVSRLYGFIYKLLRGRVASTNVADFAVWNVNAIHEMKRFTDRVELHIIAPYPYLQDAIYEYTEDGIHYHFYKHNTALVEKVVKSIPVIYDVYKPIHKKNRYIVKLLIDKVKPSIIHLIGAENPYYSLSGLDVPEKAKLIVQLQTLISDPKFLSNYPIDKRTYDYRAGIERSLIKRADYIGTTIQDYRNIIHRLIDPFAKFIDLKLAVGEQVRVIKTEKEYDFVYFARYISKACDWAIESFIEASKRKPNITMLVIGAYSKEEKECYRKMLAKYELNDKVRFTGELPTHDDVLKFVAKSKIALLPIKIDFIPSTIREANALGLPVVASITDGTPLLNEKRQCALLSKGGDHVSMANNMIKLLENSSLAEELVHNSYIRLQEDYNNTKTILKWVENYENLIF